MIELAFVACLASSPQDCRDYSLLYTEITPMACMMAAQPELATWAEAHPNLTIRRWRCRVVDLSERDA
ncbi:hypothetical protein AB1M95_03850 [Sulfitobacter sp. LCG007]